MIQWNRETLENADSITQIIAMADVEWKKRKELYERLRRKTTCSELVSNDDKNIKVAFEWYINNMTAGYFAGKTPIYDVEKVVDERKRNLIQKILKKAFKGKDTQKELKILIDYISKYNDDGTEFFDLAFDYFSLTACYEVLYENKDNEIVYTKQSALNTIGIFDFSSPVNQIGQLRKWEEVGEKNNKITILELTTVNGKFYYSPTPEDYSKYKEIKDRKKINKWTMLPCIAIENEHGISCFELVISLICAYERVIQNSRNTFQYNDEAKLKITGYTPENEILIEKRNKAGEVEVDNNENPIMIENPVRKKEDEAILKSKIFYTPDNTGDIGWIEKTIQDTALQNHKKTLIDLIAMITGVPNITDLGFTNADNASALDRKFFALEQMITTADKHFKKELLRRWETIIEKINKKESTKYDFRNIKITLLRNLPTDKQTETNRALQLRGLLSDETIIDMLPDDLDSASELQKVKDQNQENIEENMQAIIKGKGVANGSMELSQQEACTTKTTVQQDKQTDTE